MSEPVKIVVTAETAQAAAALQQFLKQYGSDLSVAGSAAKKAADDAGKSIEGLAGKVYYFRSAIDAIRFGSMDGGPRAAFYAVDELTRGLVAGGFQMTSLMPILGGVAAGVGAVTVALGAGVYWWDNYGEAMVDPARRAREMAAALEKVPALLEKINTAQRAGSISPAQAQKYLDLLSGKTPLYNEQTVPDAFGGHAPRYGVNPYGTGSDKLVQLSINQEQTIPFVAWTQGQTRQKANAQDIQDYVRQLMEKDQVVSPDDNSKPGDQALAQIHDEELKMQRDAEVGSQKEIDRIKDRYALELRELQAKKDIAVATGQWSDAEEKQFQAFKANSQTAESNSIAEIRQKAATEAAQKSAAAENKIREQYAKQFAEANRQIDDEITATTADAGQKRGQLYFSEYVQRVALAAKFFAEGKISEEQYNDAIRNAQTQALAAARQENDELTKQLQLKQEIARAQVQASLDSVKSNPFLTDLQKSQESVPIYQKLIDLNAQRIAQLQAIAGNPNTDANGQLEAQKQMTELMVQQAQLQNEMAGAQGEGSFLGQWSKEIVKLQNQFGSFAQQTAEVFGSAFDNAIHTVGGAFTGLIMQTETWSQALRNIYTSIMTNIIEGIIQMGLRWIATQLMMALFGRAILASAVAATAPMAAAQSAIWAAPATLATIASYGGAAFAAPGFISLAEGITAAQSVFGGAFAEGGRPPLGALSLVGERGPELFVPDTAGTIIPADATAAMLSAGGASSNGSAGRNKPDVHNAIYFDRDKMAEELSRSDAHEKNVVDIMGRHIHKFR